MENASLPHKDATKRVADVVAQLKVQFGERVSCNESVCEAHSHGEALQIAQMPAAVVFAESTADVSEILKLCHHHRVPVVAFGAGTSVEGHVTPPEHAISLDLSRMMEVLEVNPADLDCRVQAGLTRQVLNVQLRDTGLFFPVDPGGEATLGGCVPRVHRAQLLYDMAP